MKTFNITTAQELNNFLQYAQENNNIITAEPITANIQGDLDFSGIPYYGIVNIMYNITINGNGHIITNITDVSNMQDVIFGWFNAYDCSLSDIIFNNCYISSSAVRVFFVEYAKTGSNLTTFKNVQILNSVFISTRALNIFLNIPNITNCGLAIEVHATDVHMFNNCGTTIGTASKVVTISKIYLTSASGIAYSFHNCALENCFTRDLLSKTTGSNSRFYGIYQTDKTSITSYAAITCSQDVDINIQVRPLASNSSSRLNSCFYDKEILDNVNLIEDYPEKGLTTEELKSVDIMKAKGWAISWSN